MKAFYIFLLTLCFQNLSAQNFNQISPSYVNHTFDLCFGSQNRIFLSTSGGVYTSDDIGSSWIKLNEDFNNVYFHSKFTKNKQGDIYLYHRGIYFTNDNGDSWNKKLLFLQSDDVYITSVGLYEDKIYYGTLKGLYYIEGDNITGTLIDDFIGKDIKSIYVFENRVIVGTEEDGIYSSEDYGKTWTIISNDLPTGVKINVITISENDFFIGTYSNGVFYTNDWGKNWEQRNDGMTASYIYDLYIDGSSIYAVTDSHINVYTSTIDGKTWSLKNNGIGKTSTEQIIAKNNNLFIGATGGVYKSTDTGENWHLSIEGIYNDNIRMLQMAENGNIFASSNNKVYRKRKNDSKFEPLSHFSIPNIGKSSIFDNKLPVIGQYFLSFFDVDTEQLIEQIPMPPIRMPEIFIKTDKGYFLSCMLDGIYHYVDSEWKLYNKGLTSMYIKDFKSTGNILYAATDDGLFKLNIETDEWIKIQIDSSDPAIKNIYIKDNIFIAATPNFRSYISYDEGVTWEIIQALENNSIYALTYHNGTIYIGTYGEIFGSKDNGATWKVSKTKNYLVEAILIEDDIMYIGTNEDGIFSTPLNSNQSISFPAFPVFSLNDSEFYLEATSSSGLPLTYSNSNDEVVKLEDNKVTILAPGTTTITANQSGDLLNLPATSVSRVLTISNLITGIENKVTDKLVLSPNPGSGIFNINYESDVKLNPHGINVIDIYGKPIPFKINFVNNNIYTLDISGSSDGIYFLKIYEKNHKVKRIIKGTL